jgi:FkbH-like protein
MPTSAAAAGKEIAENLAGRTPIREFKIKICSSVYLGTTDMYLRLEGSRRGVKVSVDQGSFDNPIHDTQQIESGTSVHAVILAPFFDSIVPEFELRIHEFSEDDVSHLLESFSQRWGQAMSNVPSSTRVVILGLHSFYPTYPYGQSKKREILELFNTQLRLIAQRNLSAIYVDMESLIFKIGLQSAVDIRMYFRARSPYTSAITEELSKVITDALSIDENVVKAIALDCDNTLWGGILGEDGFEGIQIDPNTQTGSYFHLAQQHLKELKDLGILICLVSKNNEHEVLQVLDEHEYQIVRSKDVISHRINWKRKSENLVSIANELNLGLSSFVFIDDSQFECDEVAGCLPEVNVLQVPGQMKDFPDFFAKLKRLCLAGNPENSKDKTAEYRVRRKIEDDRSNSYSEGTFFEKLDIRLAISIDNVSDITRLGEMFSKTNQFNTTTIRRTPEEVKQLIMDEKYSVLSMRVTDRYTEHGLTALAIVHHSSSVIRVTDWLISCRVLGRGIEYGVLSFLGELALRSGRNKLEIVYLPTSKNRQVGDFLETVTSKVPSENGKNIFDPKALIALKPSWITI